MPLNFTWTVPTYVKLSEARVSYVQCTCYYLKYYKSDHCHLRVSAGFSLCVFVGHQFSDSNYSLSKSERTEILSTQVWNYLLGFFLWISELFGMWLGFIQAVHCFLNCKAELHIFFKQSLTSVKNIPNKFGKQLGEHRAISTEQNYQ